MLAPRQILARNLRRLRVSAGLSQEELAYRTGLHRTYISSIERGKRNVSIDNLFKIARGLEIGPEELIGPVSNGDT